MGHLSGRMIASAGNQEVAIAIKHHFFVKIFDQRFHQHHFNHHQHNEDANAEGEYAEHQPADLEPCVRKA